ncbi:hypothetical protein [Halomonas sp. BC04]|uniref:hypothetical protein n=1 Tax=Halomonas sp. BC04 TaxID=1403540 RepID=UPI0003ED62EF|nr:hypothetical protein [Halomonas sp. BC04]EWH03026.1 hypothetical protein Q427_05660 [Halomonas sp. BC04]
MTRLADDPKVTARAIAAAVASRSPKAVAAARELFTLAPGLPQRERLALEARLQGGLLGGEEQMEAVAARMEGRESDFS